MIRQRYRSCSTVHTAAVGAAEKACIGVTPVTISLLPQFMPALISSAPLACLSDAPAQPTHHIYFRLLSRLAPLSTSVIPLFYRREKHRAGFSVGFGETSCVDGGASLYLMPVRVSRLHVGGESAAAFSHGNGGGLGSDTTPPSCSPAEGSWGSGLFSRVWIGKRSPSQSTINTPPSPASTGGFSKVRCDTKKTEWRGNARVISNKGTCGQCATFPFVILTAP